MDVFGKIERLSLFGRCLARSVFCGAAKQTPGSITRIIVVPTGKLGDVVCATPVLRAIRSHFPNTRLVVAGASSLHRALLSDSGLADEYLDLEKKGALSRLKKCAADVALITGPSFKPTALLYLAGIPLIIAPKVEGGFSPSETRLYKGLQRNIKTFPYNIGEYAPRERLKALLPLGIHEKDTIKKLGYSKKAKEKVDHFFLEQGIEKKDFIVGISPSAGNKIKEWPADRFGKIADYVQENKNRKVIIVGGQQDYATADKMKKSMETKAINTTGMWNIDELKSLIARLNMFISVDTGPIYIAEAFGVPTINIVGPVDEKVQPPRGFIHRNVLPKGKRRAQLSILNARSYDKEEALRQTLSITVLDVKKEIDRLMRDLEKGVA